jgi:integrase
MHQHPNVRATGHVKLIERRDGPKFYAKFRLNGRQTTRLIGPAWLKRGRPREGAFTRQMAEAKLHELLEADPIAVVASVVTFSDACSEWLRYLDQEKALAESTLATNRSATRARLIPAFGEDTPISEITTARIDAYRAHLLTVGGASGRPLARSTVARDLTNVCGIFARAQRLGWIESNPYPDAEKIKLVASGDFNVLSVLEMEAVAEAAEDELHAALYRVAAYTGLRVGELRALRWRDVDFVNATIHVRRNLPAHATVEKVPKGKRVRSLPLFDQAARAIDGLSRRGYLTRQDDLVFSGEDGGHLGYECVRERFYTALKAAGLGHLRTKPDPLTFHDVRHSYGTMAVQIYPVTDVQVFMGHEKIETTMRYVHHVPKADAAAKGSAFIAAQIEESSVSRACPELAHSDATGNNSEHLRSA